MPRFARVVVPGCPHHITHRGNRRDDVFLVEEDRQESIDILQGYTRQYGAVPAPTCLDDPSITRCSNPHPRLPRPARPFLGRLVTGRGGWLALSELRANTYTGWPTGSLEFIALLEAQLGRRSSRPTGRAEGKRGGQCITSPCIPGVGEALPIIAFGHEYLLANVLTVINWLRPY